ncbi:MAG: hypothetical protein JXR03_18110 [Cyclobacteriaceae bacterium]
MKIFYVLTLVCFITFELHAQDQRWFGVQGGAGSAWIAMPKTYISGPATFSPDIYQLSNANNGINAYLGLTYSSQIKSSRFHFTPEMNLVYTAGDVVMRRVNTIDINAGSKSVQRKQEYWRLEVPLVFEVRTDDNFSVVLGPVLFANLHNSRAMESITEAIAPDATMSSDYVAGWRFRFGVSKIYNEKYRFIVKWDIDQGKEDFLTFNGSKYKAQLYAQSISLGFNYLFLK